MLSTVREIKETFRGWRGRAIFMTVLLGVLLSSHGCTGVPSTPADSANENKPAMAAESGLITSINGKNLSNGLEIYEGGYRAEIEGTCPDSSPNVYLVVKPDGEDYFQIQAHVVRTTRTNWIGQALLGSPESGIGNQYEVFAICTSHSYKEGEKLEREPEGSRSAVIRYKRIRN